MRQACAAAIAADRVNTTINKSKITIQIPKITIQNNNQQIAQNHNQQWNPNPQNPQNYKAWELKREKIPLNRDEQKTSCEREKGEFFVWERRVSSSCEREKGAVRLRDRERKKGVLSVRENMGVSLRERERKKGGRRFVWERRRLWDWARERKKRGRRERYFFWE